MTITSKSSVVIPFPDQKAQKIATSEKLDWIDAVVADHRIDTRAKVIAYCIMQHVNRETGIAIASDEMITDETGVPDRWVRRARNDLRAASWITWKRTPNYANRYSTLTGPMAAIKTEQQKLAQARKERRMQRRQDMQPEVRTGGQPVRPQVAEPTNVLPNVERPQVAASERPWVAEPVRPQVADVPLSIIPLENPLSKKDISANQNGSGRKTAISKHSGSNPDFESFWQAYPRKVAKLQAEKTYSRVISSGISAEVLLAGAGRYAAERAGDDPRFTKHPSTWLNAGCWNDDPQPPSRPATKSFDAFVVGARGFLNGGSNDE
jgi:hypothetical protein